MYPDDQVLFDAFTPFNVFTGALARTRGANLGTILVISLGLELVENAFVHYYGDRFDMRSREPSTNIAVGLLATAVGWTLAEVAINGGFSRAT